LMDMQMPGMDGLQACRELRRVLAAAMPIIALTANAFEEDRQACLNAGMDDFIVKPVDADLLCARVLHWLDRG
jgi:two-component system, sensor histidine kinase and response regulator